MPLATDNNSSNFVCDQEYNRQFLRITLPSKIYINDEECSLLDLSLGGFKISHENMSDILFAGSERPVRIIFDYSQFSFKINAVAKPLYKKNKEVGFKFTEIEPHQLSLLRQVIKSYLSGQIIGVSDIISIVSQNDNKSGKGPEPELLNSNIALGIGNFIILTLIAVGSIILMIFIAGNIYENQRLIKLSSGMVDADVFTLRAEKDGIFTAAVAENVSTVNINEKIGSFKVDEKNESAIISPCDCLVVQHSAKDGEFKLMGEALYKLLPMDTKPYVSASVKVQQLENIKIDNAVRVRIHGEKDFRDGKVTRISPQQTEFANLKIELEGSVPLSSFSKPAYVEILLF